MAGGLMDGLGSDFRPRFGRGGDAGATFNPHEPTPEQMNPSDWPTWLAQQAGGAMLGGLASGVGKAGLGFMEQRAANAAQQRAAQDAQAQAARAMAEKYQARFGYAPPSDISVEGMQRWIDGPFKYGIGRSGDPAYEAAVARSKGELAQSLKRAQSLPPTRFEGTAPRPILHDPNASPMDILRDLGRY